MDDLQNFEQAYSDESFREKLTRYAKAAGKEVVEKALLLYYAAQEERAPAWAKATIAGASELAITAPEDPAQLRVNVTSPGGTTQAALEVLMDESSGFRPLMKKAVHAATSRGRELRG